MDNSILWLVVCLYQVVDFELHYAIRVERGSARVKCLNQEHMIIRNPNQDTKPRPLDPESSMPTIRPLCLPGKLCLLMFVVYIYSSKKVTVYVPGLPFLCLIAWFNYYDNFCFMCFTHSTDFHPSQMVKPCRLKTPLGCYFYIPKMWPTRQQELMT